MDRKVSGESGVSWPEQQDPGYDTDQDYRPIASHTVFPSTI